ncbi:hypothetical protein P154DRAFT_31006 [Amniculicola lignicola CBS 123094]|uniref:Uncharacterized protein n=1 Tax=Amniculicola lignicola CBS 123094 TaxID=1392246 RepID=A0A6A5W0C4_9PLEO|nr:hypothetical protein P154DRAFT_31006 [Amniculicola lignicola CBS 123094]
MFGSGFSSRVSGVPNSGRPEGTRYQFVVHFCMADHITVSCFSPTLSIPSRPFHRRGFVAQHSIRDTQPSLKLHSFCLPTTIITIHCRPSPIPISTPETQQPPFPFASKDSRNSLFPFHYRNPAIYHYSPTKYHFPSIMSLEYRVKSLTNMAERNPSQVQHANTDGTAALHPALRRRTRKRRGKGRDGGKALVEG